MTSARGRRHEYGSQDWHNVSDPQSIDYIGTQKSDTLHGEKGISHALPICLDHNRERKVWGSKVKLIFELFDELFPK